MRSESRKFMDLLYTPTYQFVNWDPLTAINVGDYGMVNKETGEFEREGNLYTLQNDVDIDMTDPALRPIETEGDDTYIVKSWGATVENVDTTKEATVPGAGNVALKVEFESDGRRRAAMMVMYKAKHISIPNDERIVKLIKSKPDVLKEKYVVTQVTCCAAYVMYMSTTEVEKFPVTLHVNGPIVPAVDAGGATSFTWSSGTNHGVYREGSKSGAKYMPIYKLKEPRSKFWVPLSERGNEKIDDSIEKWVAVDPPWELIDDDGEEDPFYDAEMHGDFGVFNDGYPDNYDDDDY
ncbi:uncharacterized protein EDB93DRAFT_1103058 [Suillus bovinus]|uniref:uncharacterized protein n=1 Tax=Suillus bovinus TaxID=48563 RepID=UPI001B8869C1|nr:uncharacterized protein EDB93DRAFT_1103058 [Suillus bovinus]KAG2151621.1 hypothetical protein EDB93DRAFT_1103058 [Suillus bovinus]